MIKQDNELNELCIMDIDMEGWEICIEWFQTRKVLKKDNAKRGEQNRWFINVYSMLKELMAAVV